MTKPQDFDALLGSLTQEQTRELAKAALDNMSEADAIALIVEYANDGEIKDELLAQLEP